MGQPKKVALIQGGMSSERDVSLVTGKAFGQALDKLGYNYEVIDAGLDLPARLIEMKPDVALLALHGKYAEDGTVQGICEYLKIPYSGSGVLASALCMDKYYTKQILTFHEIPTPEFEFFNMHKVKLQEVKTHLSFPVVVKPSRDGSSMGISICRNQEEFLGAVEKASVYDNEVLVEKCIEGHEVTVPIFNNKALTPIEIVPKEGFYDYQRKYTAGQTQYFLPPRIDESIVRRCQEIAVKVHEVTKARVYSRVDFRIAKDGSPFVIEINTLPGCTSTSLLPQSAAHDGIDFTEVIESLIQNAGLDYEGLR